MKLYQLVDGFGDNVCLVAYTSTQEKEYSDEEAEEVLVTAYEQSEETEQEIDEFLPDGFERVYATEITV